MLAGHSVNQDWGFCAPPGFFAFYRSKRVKIGYKKRDIKGFNKGQDLTLKLCKVVLLCIYGYYIYFSVLDIISISMFEFLQL